MKMDRFCTYEVPRSCPTIEKTMLLGLSRVEGPLSNRVDSEWTGAQRSLRTAQTPGSSVAPL